MSKKKRSPEELRMNAACKEYALARKLAQSKKDKYENARQDFFLANILKRSTSKLKGKQQ